MNDDFSKLREEWQTLKRKFDTVYSTIYPNAPLLTSQRNKKTYTVAVSQGDPRFSARSLQNAINEANRLGGGDVLITAGTYSVSQTIDLYSNINLVGVDRSSCVIDFGSTTACMRANGTSSSHRNDISIRNLTFQNCAIASAGSACITLYYTDNSYIENCAFIANKPSSGTLGGDMYLDGCNDLRIRNNVSSNTNRFIRMGTTTPAPNFRFFISENFVGTPVYQFFLDTDGNENHIITKNIVLGHQNVCFDSPGETTGYIIANNFFTGSSTSITLGRLENGVIQGNSLTGPSGTTVGLIMGSATVNTVVSGNNFFGFGTGVYFKTASLNTVTGNNIEATPYGVFLDATSGSNVVVGNFIRASSGTPIQNNGTGNVTSANGTFT